MQVFLTAVSDDHPDPTRRKRWQWTIARQFWTRGAHGQSYETGFARDWDDAIQKVAVTEPTVEPDAALWVQDSAGDWVWSTQYEKE